MLERAGDAACIIWGPSKSLPVTHPPHHHPPAAVLAPPHFHPLHRQDEKLAQTPAKAKGFICPCGYTVTSVSDAADVARLGEFVLCLKPRDSRRAWYLRADSAEQRSRWKAVRQE